MSYSKKMVGKRFSLLTVIKKGKLSKYGQYWLCRCKCGNLSEVRGTALRCGATRSCGCTKAITLRNKPRRLLKSLGMRHTTEYGSFAAAKNRCTNPNNPAWKNYGGRGIKFLFKSFKEFFLELGNKPRGTSLDRKDNDGNYEPGNCQWATRIEQIKNQVRAVSCPHCGGKVKVVGGKIF